MVRRKRYGILLFTFAVLAIACVTVCPAQNQTKKVCVIIHLKNGQMAIGTFVHAGTDSILFTDGVGALREIKREKIASFELDPLPKSGICSSTAFIEEPTPTPTPDRIDRIIQSAEDHYERGRTQLALAHWDEARKEFDKAVDTILDSGLDARDNPRLQSYYLKLVERINQFKFPAPRPPQEITAQPEPTPQIIEAPLKEKTCTAEQVEKIKIRGFYLGMSQIDVNRRFPTIKIKRVDEYGFARLNIAPGVNIPNTAKNRADFEGVIRVRLDFVDDHLVTIYVVYDQSVKWDNSWEFVGRISESLGLLPMWSEYRDDMNYRGELKTLSCDQYVFVAGIIGYAGKSFPIVLLDNRTAATIINKRVGIKKEKIELEEEKKRQTFKP